MIDVNWDLAPEGADRVVVRFYNGDDMSCKKVIHHPIQQKTVADAVEQEGEKWTHTHNDEQCYIATTYNDRAWIVRQAHVDIIVDMKELKPIKPTMTKAEAWDYAVASGLYSEEIEKKYDII